MDFFKSPITYKLSDFVREFIYFLVELINQAILQKLKTLTIKKLKNIDQ